MRAVLQYALLASAGYLTGCTGTGRLTSEPAAFTNPRRVIILGYNDHAMEPFFSRDGRYLFFNNLNDPAVNTNLHWAERVDEWTFEYKGEVSGTNTPGIVNFDAEISADGGALYFVESQFGPTGPRTADILIADKQGTGFHRNSKSGSILQRVNTGALEYAPAGSASGLEILFTRLDGDTPGIYAATRTSPSAPFDAPTRVQAITGFVEAATFSPDGRMIYYHKRENDQFVIYAVTRP